METFLSLSLSVQKVINKWIFVVLPHVVIGGGLALNDTEFYTGSGNVPYVQFESVGDFIPEPRCSKFAVGLQTEGERWGCKRPGRTLIWRAESDGSSYVRWVFERVLEIWT